MLKKTRMMKFNIKNRVTSPRHWTRIAEFVEQFAMSWPSSSDWPGSGIKPTIYKWTDCVVKRLNRKLTAHFIHFYQKTWFSIFETVTFTRCTIANIRYTKILFFSSTLILRKWQRRKKDFSFAFFFVDSQTLKNSSRLFVNFSLESSVVRFLRFEFDGEIRMRFLMSCGSNRGIGRKPRPGVNGFALDVIRLVLPEYRGWFNGKNNMKIDRHKQKNPANAM